MMPWKTIRVSCLAIIVATVWSGCAMAITTYMVTVLTNSSKTACGDEFLSVTLDSAAITTNLTQFNFSSAKMLNIAKALGPCNLRIGGILADFLLFFPGNITNPQAFMNSYKTVDGTYYPLTQATWDQITTFAKKAKWSIAYDFSIFVRQNGRWDSSNAELFLNYSAAKGIQISEFQLGNEAAHYPRLNNVNITPSNMSTDLSVLRGLISRYPMYKNSHILGPSVTHTGSSMTYLRSFVAAGGVNYTNETDFHHYFCESATASPADFVNMTLLDTLEDVFDTVTGIVSRAAHPTRLRLSETSSCSGGGLEGISDKYMAGFMWLYKLGLSALYGLSKVNRQTFIGGQYYLVSVEKFVPSPDFYLSVLHKQLVRGPVFNVTFIPAQPNLRIFANCARRDIYNYPLGALVLYYLNLGLEDIILSLNQFALVHRDLFLLTPGDSYGLNSSSVKLNGQLLSMPGDTVPTLSPVSKTGDITVTAQSFGFIAIPQANVAACISYFSVVKI